MCCYEMNTAFPHRREFTQFPTSLPPGDTAEIPSPVRNFHCPVAFALAKFHEFPQTCLCLAPSKHYFGTLMDTAVLAGKSPVSARRDTRRDSPSGRMILQISCIRVKFPASKLRLTAPRILFTASSQTPK